MMPLHALPQREVPAHLLQKRGRAQDLPGVCQARKPHSCARGIPEEVELLSDGIAADHKGAVVHGHAHGSAAARVARGV